MNISQELKGLIPPLSESEKAQLEANCKADGIRDALIIARYPNEDGEAVEVLADGHNRYEIAQDNNLPYKTEVKEFDSLSDVKVWMFFHQLGRRNLTDGWKWELSQGIREELLEKGKEKRSEAGEKGGRGNIKHVSLNDTCFEAHSTRTEVAETLNWSKGKTAQAEQVWKKAPEEVKQAVRDGEMTIGGAYKEVKKAEKKDDRLAKIEEIKKSIAEENLVKPDKKYHVIAIDPPWAYDEKGGFSSDDHDADGLRGGVDYPTMTVEQIKQIELPDAEDAVCFLWTTHAFLRDSFEILENWGYSYKATLAWDKVKMGIGRTVRMQLEFCLIGVKGSPMISGQSQRDIITEPRREHSRKPEAFYEMAEAMCIGNKLDYFSRQNRENWDHYGAETNKF